MKKILIVEDDETISFGLSAALRKHGFEPLACASLAAGEAAFAEAGDIALILLDWNLPDGTGYEFCRKVKAIRDVPVIFLTVRDEEQDIVRGLDLGADDYIVKPFRLSVLLSRINAVLRRTKNAGQAVLSCGAIVLDKRKAAAWLAGRELSLTAGEYRLLSVLLEHKNQTLTRSQLLDKLWDAEGNFVNDNTLTVTIKRLREKLDHTDCLKTIRGIGYRMEELP
ncbi:response regulator transcription factor [Paenibacillus phocaensis]|uniref:response regulator transcription factor n=1 Tax=Paenibacillus phocaensis TaxID=1776378 RepID=UPI000839CD97|nr:response regulator transcription factor [Paenibacillus phocaensis]